MAYVKKEKTDCPRCDGKGKDPQDETCGLCEGKGKLQHLKVGDNEITVKDGALFRG